MFRRDDPQLIAPSPIGRVAIDANAIRQSMKHRNGKQLTVDS